MRILHVYESEALRDLVGEMLRLAGHRVFPAHGAQAARLCLEKNTYDALLVNGRLPDGDGPSFLQWLGPDRPPAVGLTGSYARGDDFADICGVPVVFKVWCAFCACVTCASLVSSPFRRSDLLQALERATTKN